MIRKEKEISHKEIKEKQGDDIFLKKKLLLYLTALFADAYTHQEGKDIQKKNKFPFILSLISLCCNSLAPARLAPSGLPSAVDPAAATPHVFFVAILFFALCSCGYNFI